MTPKRVTVPAIAVTIYIAGDYDEAARLCRAYCDESGFCVTVRPELYVYTGGAEEGVAIGLINYARLPLPREELLRRAEIIAERLREGLNQQSYTIQDAHESLWVSWRPCDVQ